MILSVPHCWAGRQQQQQLSSTLCWCLQRLSETENLQVLVLMDSNSDISFCLTEIHCCPKQNEKKSADYFPTHINITTFLHFIFCESNCKHVVTLNVFAVTFTLNPQISQLLVEKVNFNVDKFSNLSCESLQLLQSTACWLILWLMFFFSLFRWVAVLPTVSGCPVHRVRIYIFM